MKGRKKLPKTALPRIYLIDRQIASGTYPNANTLAKAYETSPSTIARDIDFMRTVLNAPIAFDHNHNGYYYAEKTYRVPAGFATADELITLGMVKTLLSLYRDTPLYRAAEQLLNIITAPLGDPKVHAAEPPWYETRIVIPPIASALVSKETWECLTQGLRENRMIAFDYLSTWDEEYQAQRVCPYQLFFDKGVWYLYGAGEGGRVLAVFSLVRIKHITLTEESFTLPPDYDYSSKAGSSYFGLFAGERSYHFRVLFNGTSVVWVQQRKWAADQRIEKSPQGLIIDFTSTQYEQVLAWVLSRNDTARPLEPPALVEDWRETLRVKQKPLECSPAIEEAGGQYRSTAPSG